MARNIAFLFLLASSSLMAQRKMPWSHIDFENRNSTHLIYKGGVAVQSDLYLELGLAFAKQINQSYSGVIKYRGWSTTFEFNVTGDKQLYAPRLGYEWNLAYVGARMSTAYYSDFKNSSDLRLTPEAGISLFGVITFYFGYNIPLLAEPLEDVGKIRISLYVNIAR